MLRCSVASKRLRSFAVRTTRGPGWPLASIRLARPRPAADVVDRACLRDFPAVRARARGDAARSAGVDVVSCGITGTTSPASSGSRSGALLRTASNRRVTPIRDARQWRKALVSVSWAKRQAIRPTRPASARARGSASTIPALALSSASLGGTKRPHLRPPSTISRASPHRRSASLSHRTSGAAACGSG